MQFSVHSTLTDDAIRELSELLKTSRRSLSDFYRQYNSRLSIEDIARSNGHADLKKVRSQFSALQIIFGREKLPKRGGGRQQAIYEAEFWLKSNEMLSDELIEHFETILKLAEKTNTRRSDIYSPPTPPKHFTLKDRPREGDFSGVYALTTQANQRNSDGKTIRIKIGWSHMIWDRISSAQTWDPEPLIILRVFPCINPNIVESKMHIVLDTLGLGVKEGGGIEWFDVPLELIDSVAAALQLEDCLGKD